MKKTSRRSWCIIGVMAGLCIVYLIFVASRLYGVLAVQQQQHQQTFSDVGWTKEQEKDADAHRRSQVEGGGGGGGSSRVFREAIEEEQEKEEGDEAVHRAKMSNDELEWDAEGPKGKGISRPHKDIAVETEGGNDVGGRGRRGKMDEGDITAEDDGISIVDQGTEESSKVDDKKKKKEKEDKEGDLTEEAERRRLAKLARIQRVREEKKRKKEKAEQEALAVLRKNARRERVLDNKERRKEAELESMREAMEESRRREQLLAQTRKKVDPQTAALVEAGLLEKRKRRQEMALQRRAEKEKMKAKPPA